jgi:putative transposase
MIIPNDYGCAELTVGGKLSHMQNLSKAIGKTLSSYTKAINIQNRTIGNLFQKKTKAKLIEENNQLVNNYKISDYLTTCFYYIHQNPLKAKLVENLESWRFSSWPDYAGLRNGNLCNKEKLFLLTGLNANDCLNQSHVSDEKIISQIF